MANLYVTYSSAYANPARVRAVPLAIGSVARSEIIVIGATAAGLLAALGSDDVVELVAEADCWVAIGAAPDPEAVDDDGAILAHFLKADAPYQFIVAEGELVAAIDATLLSAS